MTTLYEIAAQYRDNAAKLSDMELDEQAIADTLESMGGELEVKAQNITFLIRNLDATANAIKQAEERMAKRRKAIENRIAGLSRYVLSGMQVAGVEKIECQYFELSIRQNPPAVDVFDERQIPESYMRSPPPVPDKTLIKDALKRGEDVPGCRLSQSQRLDIK